MHCGILTRAVDNPEGYGVGNNKAITYAWNPVAYSNLTPAHQQLFQG
jgi:hypothetical protein